MLSVAEDATGDINLVLGLCASVAIHSFIHSFSQPPCVAPLLCARPHARLWGYGVYRGQLYP